jgi:PGF-pre-PGF domain-containing protein
MNITNQEIAIIKITIEIRETVKNVQIQVTALTEAPQTAIAMKTEVYQYLKIDKVNIENTGITAATIKFRVPKPWLSERKLSYDQIALYKYVNNNWEELDTTVLNSDSAYVHYEAKTSGFSYFAVGVKEIRKEAPYVEEEKKPEVIIPQEEAVAPEEKKAPEITGAAVTVPGGAITPLAVAWIVIILAIIAAVFIFIEIRRKTPTPSFKELKKRSKEIDKKIEKIDEELKNPDKK